MTIDSGAAADSLPAIRRRALLGLARNAVAADDLVQALAAYEQVLQEFPGDNDAGFELAGLLMRRGDWPAAEERLRALIANDHRAAYHDRYAIALADVLVQRQRRAEAVALLRERARLSDCTTLLRLRLGRHLAWQKDWQAAEEAADEATTGTNTLTRDETLELARFHLNMGRPDAAIECVDGLLRYSGDVDFASEAIRLQALSELGRFKQTEVLVERLGGVPLDDQRPRLALGDSLYRSGRNREALSVYRQAAERLRQRGPIDPQLRAKIVRTQVRLLKLPEAESFLGPPTENEDPELLAARANFLTVAGRHAEAEQVCRQLLALDPSDPDHRNAYGHLYFSIGDYLRAEAEYRQSLCLAPGSLKTLPFVARAMARSHQHAEAVVMLRREMTGLRRARALRAVLIEVLLDAGWSNEALRQCRLAMADARGPREVAWAKTQLGWALLKTGDLARAVGELQAVVESTASREAKAVYGLAKARRQLGQAGRSRALLDAFELAVAGDPVARLAMADLATAECDGCYAERLLLRPSAAAPGNPILLIRLGEAVSLADRPRGTARDRGYFCQALSVSPGNTRAMLGLARSYSRTRHVGEACRFYHEILDGLPSHRLAAGELSRVTYGASGPDAGVAAYARERRRVAADRAANPVAVAAKAELQFPDAEALSPGARSLQRSPSAAEIERAQGERTQKLLRLEQCAKHAKPWRPRSSIPLYQRTINSDRINEEAAFDLGQVYGTLNRTRDAACEFSRLLDVNPCHSEAEWAIARTQYERGPQWWSSVDFEDLSGRDGLTDISRTRFATYGRVPLDRFNRPGDEDEYLYAGYAHRSLVDGLSQTISGNALLIGGAAKPWRYTRLFADIEIADFDQGFDTRPAGRAGVQHRTRRDVQWTFAGFLNNVQDNSESIAQDIFRTGAEVSFVSTPDWRTTLSGGYRWSDYSDDNESTELFLTGERLLRYGCGRCQWRLLADLYYFDFEEQTVFGPGGPGVLAGTVHPYFAPDGFAFTTVGLEYKRWLSRHTHKYANHWWWSIYAGGRVDNQGIGYGVGRVRLHRDYRAWLTAGAEASAVRSDVFDSTLAQVYLTVRWR